MTVAFPARQDPAPGGEALAGLPFIDAVLDPRAAFARPDDVVRHARLSREEKRLILWGWARDLLREARDGPPDPMQVEAALQALAWFDAAAADGFEAAFPARDEADPAEDEVFG